jgi:cell fate regulator YaaT (PSP1 superfamily)
MDGSTTSTRVRANYRVGGRVLVPTDSGPEVAECAWAPEWVEEEFGALPVCAGLAGAAHVERDAVNRRRRAEVKLVAKRLIKRLDLPMKVVGVDFLDAEESFDQLAVVYFTAPQRVDFRVLVGQLARSLRARIDLRQVGSRDAARLTSGLGSCGRELCCATFLTEFEPVSLRMAKAQDLPANPLRISGACGRLMCCLKYEHPLYASFAREVPAVGQTVAMPEGEAVVVAHSVPTDSVVLRMSATGQVSPCSRAAVCGARHAYEERSTPTGQH